MEIVEIVVLLVIGGFLAWIVGAGIYDTCIDPAPRFKDDVERDGWLVKHYGMRTPLDKPVAQLGNQTGLPRKYINTRVDG